MIKKGTTVEYDGCPRVDLIGNETGDREFLISLTLNPQEEIILLAERVCFDQRRAAVMSPHDSAAFERVQRPAHRGDRAIETVSQRLQVRVFVFANMALDQIRASHAADPSGRQ